MVECREEGHPWALCCRDGFKSMDFVGFEYMGVKGTYLPIQYSGLAKCVNSNPPPKFLKTHIHRDSELWFGQSTQY